MSLFEVEQVEQATGDTAVMEEFAAFLSLNNEDAAAELLWNTGSTTRETRVAQLKQTCATLFRRIETLGKQCTSEKTALLSGLETLYTGDDDDDDSETAPTVNAETVWGQVELQNAALVKLLKRNVKQLRAAAKESGSQIRLLEDMESEGEESNSESEDDENRNCNNNETDDVDDDDDGSDAMDDEETKRIRARMDRAMDEDTDDDDDPSSEESSDEKEDFDNEQELKKDKDAANLHDGFFNLQEMEAFADEEEEYLPDTAYGEEKPGEDEPADKRSFHQKQRDGDVDGDSDVDEEEGGLLFRKETTVRRRKYRKDDEIEALHKLYDEANDDDDEDDEIINMTAADLYGKPNQTYIERYKTKHKSDDDSWNEFDFDQQQGDKGKSGWNGSDQDDQESCDESQEGKDSDEEGKEDDSGDEEKPMKGNKKQHKLPTKQAEKILAQTEQLEKDMLAEKPWQMTGETGSTARPVNSLLESTPQFEVATKLAPTITVDHTKNLEEIIKKRILAEDWDDVIPRELPDVGWHKKRGELPEVSQEKSKLSLGELYEREYLRKAVGYDKDAAEKETEEDKAKNEMKTLFANLCSKLDALSNYHFAPRPVADEAEVRTVTQPAIAMEEVLPLYVSDARGVAPEEVYGAKRGREAVLRTDSELDQQDRKRMRHSKKSARRKARKAKLADEKLISRLQPGLGLNNPYEKRKMREELAAARAGGKVTTGKADMNDYGASTTFFQRLQQETEQSVHGEKQGSDDRKKAARTNTKSSALKL